MYLISIEGMYLSRQINQREVSLNMKDPDVPNKQGGFNKRANDSAHLYAVCAVLDPASFLITLGALQ